MKVGKRKKNTKKHADDGQGQKGAAGSSGMDRGPDPDPIKTKLGPGETLKRGKGKGRS